MNSGSISELSFKASFNENGTPKPVIIVGANGSGKTTFLSIVADALTEIAAIGMQDVVPNEGLRRPYLRTLGGRTTQLGRDFELMLAAFKHETWDLHYRAKVGQVEPADLGERLAPYGPVSSWNKDDSKVAIADSQLVEKLFKAGTYVFFPVNRFEPPHWLNLKSLFRDPDVDFDMITKGSLATKPITVETSFRDLKSWLLGILADAGISPFEIINSQNLEHAKSIAATRIPNAITLSSVNALLTVIMQRNARVARLSRGIGDRRICIADDQQILVPTLENLSSAQTSLLSIFGTILMYGDSGALPIQPQAIEGIVLVDEIDAHLHSDLQHDALPTLIQMFPRVQFFLTAHSPLFPLGMRQRFGDGFTLLEMPSGNTIDAERYRDFESSFSYLHSTSRFERSVRDRVEKILRPLVLCEGETDPKYLVAAAELLNRNELLEGVNFEWIGAKTPSGASGGGTSGLDNAARFLENNPQFLPARVVLLYDCDARKSPKDSGNLLVRSLPQNYDNNVTNKGIENLLPDEVFEDHFFLIDSKRDGTKTVTVRDLNKVALCVHLCEVVRNREHFLKFEKVLLEFERLLLEDH